MKILTTAILLVTTLLAVPLFSLFFGTALGPAEWRAMHTLMIMAGIVIAYTFITGQLTGNNSQVDKLWSLLPIAYSWVVAGYSDWAPRLVIMRRRSRERPMSDCWERTTRWVSGEKLAGLRKSVLRVSSWMA